MLFEIQTGDNLKTPRRLDASAVRLIEGHSGEVRQHQHKRGFRRRSCGKFGTYSENFACRSVKPAAKAHVYERIRGTAVAHVQSVTIPIL
jgi:hypothetical protein